MTKACNLIMSFVFTSYGLVAQNLVPNPSFEEGTTLCGPAESSAAFVVYAHNWSSPNKSTPDILSLGMPPECFSAMPNSGTFPPNLGSQLPHSGSRFAGIYTGSNYTINEIQFTWREYIQAELIEPLILGEYYNVEMYVSLAEESRFAANNLGVAFADQLIFENTYSTLPISPQITESQIISDSINWVKIANAYRATAPYPYLIIGNFFYDHETNFLPAPTPNPQVPGAYYFLDDVIVNKIPCPSLNFTDNIICQGDSALVGVHTSYNNFNYPNIQWTTLSDTLTVLNTGTVLKVKPTQTTSYRAIIKDGCNVKLKDTVTVFVNPAPEVMLGNDTTLCKGATKILDAGQGYSKYDWQDHSNDRFFSVSLPGIYSVQVENDYGCLTEDEINIAFEDVPKVDLGSDKIICDEYIPLIAGGIGFTYHWSTGSTDSVIVPSQAGKYWVTVENQCGNATDSINVFSFKDIFIPNVLTPNGDGFNEKFIIKEIGEEITGHLEIYNRWGAKIFDMNNYQGDWPYENEIPETGIYYYALSFQQCKKYRGWIQVLK